jgi:alcohol dehydrogenase class IV
MDVAKVVAVLLASDQPLQEMYGVDQVQRRAAAADSGTHYRGHRLGGHAGGGDHDRRNHQGRGELGALLPDLAVLDAELTLGLPPKVTAMTGVDAMVHAIEAYTSKLRKNPISDSLARSALPCLRRISARRCTTVRDRDARAAMLLGAMQAGQAFANAPVAAVHALAYPLGGHYHIPHGLSNSLVLPSVLRFNLPAAASAYTRSWRNWWCPRRCRQRRGKGRGPDHALEP